MTTLRITLDLSGDHEDIRISRQQEWEWRMPERDTLQEAAEQLETAVLNAFKRTITKPEEVS